MTIIDTTRFRRPSGRPMGGGAGSSLSASGQAVGRTVSALGQQFTRMAELEAGRLTKDSAKRQSATIDQLIQDAMASTEQARRESLEAAPPGGTGHAKSVAEKTKSLVDDSVLAFEQAHVGEPGAREAALRLRSRLGDIALDSYRQADAFERVAGRRSEIDNASQVAAAYAKRAIESPDSAEAFYQFGLSSIEERDLPDEVKGELTQGYRSSFARLFLDVLMSEAPEKVGEAARSELFSGALGQPEIEELEKRATLERGWQERIRQLAEGKEQREGRLSAAVGRVLQVESLEQAVTAGKANAIDIERLQQSGELRQAEARKLNGLARRWNEREEQRAKNIERIAKLLEEQDQLDEGDPAIREAAHDYYERFLFDPRTLALSPEDQNATIARLTQQTRLLPKAVVDRLRDQLDGSPDDQVIAADLVERLDGLPVDIPLPLSPRTVARARLVKRYQRLGQDPATAARNAQEATKAGDATRDKQRAAELAELPPITAEEILQPLPYRHDGIHVALQKDELLQKLPHRHDGTHASEEENGGLTRDLLDRSLTPDEEVAVERFAAALLEREFRLTGDEATARDTAIRLAERATLNGALEGDEYDQQSKPPIPTRRPFELAEEGQSSENTPPTKTKQPINALDENQPPPIPAIRPTADDVANQGGDLLEHARRTGVINEPADIGTPRGLEIRVAQAKRANEAFGRYDVVPLTSAELEDLSQSLVSLDPSSGLEKLEELAEAFPPMMYVQVAQKLGQENGVLGFVATLGVLGRDDAHNSKSAEAILAGAKYISENFNDGKSAEEINELLSRNLGLNYDDVPTSNKPIVDAAIAHFIGTKIQSGRSADLDNIRMMDWYYFGQSVDAVLQSSKDPTEGVSLETLKDKLTEPIELRIKRTLLEAVPEDKRENVEQFFDSLVGSPPQTEAALERLAQETEGLFDTLDINLKLLSGGLLGAWGAALMSGLPVAGAAALGTAAVPVGALVLFAGLIITST